MTSVPAFVGGFRSGSTLLINLLGLHPEIAPWFETKSFCEALRWQRVLNEPATEAFEHYVLHSQSPTGFTTAAVSARMHYHIGHTAARIAGQLPSGKAAHEHYPLGTDHVLYTQAEAEAALQHWQQAVGTRPSADSVAMATGELIRTLGERQTTLAKRPYWINKTPEAPRFGKELRRCLGRCRIIHLVRDGRQVARSAMQLGWGDIERMATLWKEMITLSRAAGIGADYLEVRYETLIRQPATELERILVFLELEPVGKQLRDAYQQATGGQLGSATSQSPPLEDSDLNRFNAIAGDLLTELGYR